MGVVGWALLPLLHHTVFITGLTPFSVILGLEPRIHARCGEANMDPRLKATAVRFKFSGHGARC
ncbi:hypothetical protein Rleg2_0553 [Rhizobium leguminosarum bv. trifolii WSM2304]|uniref:Uncharacterized protein n=1 Tax=Rhizobium leguminosarum bv. trifolii (strain WSM2304) TaxID=395492 RepID=A0ABF7QJ11_RHILW|nr:hypothetical protein Rleg2_0553 [Rhizobium leguminosarum bv. trifolii WSM2304]